MSAERGPRDVVLVSTSTAFGGAEVYLGELARALSDEIRFRACVPEGAAATTVSMLGDAGVEVIRVAGLGRRPGVTAARRLGRAIAACRAELVHVNLTDQGDGIVAALALVGRGVPCLSTLHLVLPQRAPWKELLSRRVLRSVGPTIACSEAVLGYVRGAGLDARLVPLGRTPPTLLSREAARRELSFDAGDLVVGGIGRIDRQKGWDVLCAAAAIVRRDLPHARFAVLGAGAGHELATGVERDGVRFLGFREDAASLVLAFDVLAVPSRYEALGLVAVEGMLAGVPVVASAVGGLVEAVGDGGVLVPPEDPEALAGALLSLLTDPVAADALGRRGRGSAEGRFAVERMALGTRRVYAEACR